MYNREKWGQSVPTLTGKGLRLGSLRTTETTQGVNLEYNSNHKTKGNNDENCDIKNNNLILKRIRVCIMDLNPYHTSKQH